MTSVILACFIVYVANGKKVEAEIVVPSPAQGEIPDMPFLDATNATEAFDTNVGDAGNKAIENTGAADIHRIGGGEGNIDEENGGNQENEEVEEVDLGEDFSDIDEIDDSDEEEELEDTEVDDDDVWIEESDDNEAWLDDFDDDDQADTKEEYEIVDTDDEDELDEVSYVDLDETDEAEIWMSGSFVEIADLLDCVELDEEERKIPSMETWNVLRQVYGEVVEQTSYSLPRKNVTDGFQVKYSVQQNHRGRTIIAEQNILRGNVIWRSTNTGRFLQGNEYRHFMRSLPQELACEILEWSYTRLNAHNKSEICVDFDPGCLVNGCDYEEECNLVPGKSMDRYSGCVQELVAGRDIVLGEEILMDYIFSEGDAGWSELGFSNKYEVRVGIDDYYKKVSGLFKRDWEGLYLDAKDN